MFVFVNETTGNMACTRSLFDLHNEIEVAHTYGYYWSVFNRDLVEVNQLYVLGLIHGR